MGKLGPKNCVRPSVTGPTKIGPGSLSLCRFRWLPLVVLGFSLDFRPVPGSVLLRGWPSARKHSVGPGSAGPDSVGHTWLPKQGPPLQAWPGATKIQPRCGCAQKATLRKLTGLGFRILARGVLDISETGPQQLARYGYGLAPPGCVFNETHTLLL